MQILLNEQESQEYLKAIQLKQTSSKEGSLLKDILSEKILPEVETKEVSSPFVNKRYHPWTPGDINTIVYCASETTPKSQRTLEYLKQKLPTGISMAAIRSKLTRLGYNIKKGVICKI